MTQPNPWSPPPEFVSWRAHPDILKHLKPISFDEVVVCLRLGVPFVTRATMDGNPQLMLSTHHLDAHKATEPVELLQRWYVGAGARAWAYDQSLWEKYKK